MSVNVTRIIGYGIYLPYDEFNAYFAVEEFDKFCDTHSKLQVGKTCFAFDHADGEWAFFGMVLAFAEDCEELDNINLSELAHRMYDVDYTVLPFDYRNYPSKFMYLTEYS